MSFFFSSGDKYAGVLTILPDNVDVKDLPGVLIVEVRGNDCSPRMSAVFINKEATTTCCQLIVSGVYDKPLAAHRRCHVTNE